MNERIQELVKQATETVKCGLNGTSTAESFNRKKFAELIVRECADWMESATVTDSAGNKDHIGDSFFWADELKKHFGVE